MAGSSAYEFCESTGMRQMYARDETSAATCNPNPTEMEWYTHDCCAEDMDIPVTAGVTYWFAVTGAVGRAAAARARARGAPQLVLRAFARTRSPPRRLRLVHRPGQYNLNLYCEDVDDDAFHSHDSVDQWWSEIDCDCCVLHGGNG